MTALVKTPRTRERRHIMKRLDSPSNTSPSLMVWQDVEICQRGFRRGARRESHHERHGGRTPTRSAGRNDTAR